MFDGLNYKYEFETACESLMLESDGAQVRRTLIGVEWVLAEAIHGVFMLSAILQTVAAMFLVGWLLDFNSMDSLAKVIFGAVVTLPRTSIQF